MVLYSTLYLASGYWQVEVDAADREKTAFTNPYGLFQFSYAIWTVQCFGAGAIRITVGNLSCVH